mmetsp:Transcript_39565/g.128047  ORF Transcript_39565/g.128047 Transcript_39565/m.128047 type:complete len:225 (+) Transcript_39565:1-675(+)
MRSAAVSCGSTLPIAAEAPDRSSSCSSASSDAKSTGERERSSWEKRTAKSAGVRRARFGSPKAAGCAAGCDDMGVPRTTLTPSGKESSAEEARTPPATTLRALTEAAVMLPRLVGSVSICHVDSAATSTSNEPTSSHTARTAVSMAVSAAMAPSARSTPSARCAWRSTARETASSGGGDGGGGDALGGDGGSLEDGGGGGGVLVKSGHSKTPSIAGAERAEPAA